MAAAQVFDLLFHQKLLNPSQCPQVALVNKDCFHVIETHRKKYPYESIQSLVDNRGFFTHSIDALKSAVNLGYTIWDRSIAYLVRHEAPEDVLMYAIRTNSCRVPAIAIVEAWTKNTNLYSKLYRIASLEVREEVDEWIDELERKGRRTIQWT
jgi:hypothetical protein